MPSTMPKKKPKSSKAPTKKAHSTGSTTRPANTRWLLNTPPELKEWATEQAESVGISRDAFMRLLLEGARKQMQALDQMDNEGLFDELVSKLETRLHAAVQNAAENASLRQVRQIRPTKK